MAKNKKNGKQDSVLAPQKQGKVSKATQGGAAQNTAGDAPGATQGEGGEIRAQVPQRAPGEAEAQICAREEGVVQPVAEAAPGKRRLVVTVYAIALNEEKFAKRWFDSMKEADHIVVLDTGSTDKTVDILRSLGATVEVEKYERWQNIGEYDAIVAEGKRPHRFEVERNRSMQLIPQDTDVCVCTDLDEILCPGWRAKLETAWQKALDEGRHPTTGTYEYVWSFNPDGTDCKKFTYKKVHAPGVCKWTHPVHEVLDYGANERVEVAIPGMRLEHHADPRKSRRSYLPMLELSVREAPDDDRNTHYLGREYMFNHLWRKAIETLEHHLSMPSATWKAERAASMRYIARCHREQGRWHEAAKWLNRAVNETREYREAAVELAQLGYDMAIRKDTDDKRVWWELCASAARKAVAITRRIQSYTTDDANWGYRPWDLLALALWNTGRRVESLEAAKKALSFAPGNRRLRGNVEVIEKSLKKSAT